MTEAVKKLKTTSVQIRMTEFQKNKLQMIADRYAGGSLTVWIEHCIDNAPRKFLVKPKQP